MKVTAVRLIENKDPVGVFGGWMSDSSLDLNLIRECVYPDECEFIETEIPKKMFGVIWTNVRKDDELIPSEMQFTLELKLDIIDTFTVEYFFWEKFLDYKGHKSEEDMDKRIEGLNNEINYLNEKIIERDISLECSVNMITTSIMFMFVSWAVTFVSMALLILK